MKDLFKRDFTLVVIGQIISLFGNQILRFALPLYLLNVTGSAALFGTISAIAFIPMILLCPIGGIIADRINKRNIMVILDFSTSALIGLFCIALGQMNIVVLLLITLILLYGIQGAYQPAVQSSIPALLKPDCLMQGNAVINLVSSMASLIGPVIGGILYAFCGIRPILYISIICFFLSAVMEIFIHIPFEKKASEGNILSIGYHDLKDSFHFITKEQPQIWQVSMVMAAINMFLSSLVIIGLPIIVTQYLGFSEQRGNELYGYAQGAIAAGSLIGGLGAGIFGKKLRAGRSPLILFICSLTLIPIGIALQFPMTAMTSYIIIMISCVLMLATAALFSIQMMALLQILTPANLIGKVISCAMCISMCSQPLGQALYGQVFEHLGSMPYIPFYVAFFITVLICILSRKTFIKVELIAKDKL